jgi:hypothetical protein
MNLQPLLSWRPAWWLRLVVLVSVSQRESLTAQRAIFEHNVHELRKWLAQAERELRGIDYAIRRHDETAREAGVELAARRAA